MPLLSYIDQPATWDALSRCVIVRGWCFGADGEAITGVRLRFADRDLHGVVGLPRPDVKAALPNAPGDDTGFEVRGTLPAGRHELSLDARLRDGTWTTFFTRIVTIPRLWLPLWAGGGEWTELMFFQMPAHMAYPPRAIAPEKFPSPRARARPHWPKFSIVTPSYQQAQFLPATMRSVLDDQPGVRCDYVVFDGGSRDGSAELIAAEAPRLLAWTSQPDGGQADAIAKGFAHTSGEPEDVMGWINSDDFYLPGALAFVADYFARHPDVDVVYGNRVIVDEESREVGRWFLPPHDAEVLRLNDFVPQETVFWRRRVWDRVGGLDTKFKFALDWDLLLRFQAAGSRIVRLPYFLACFRVHAAQKTSAVMHSTGQQEITLLRERTHGRTFPPHEIEGHPRLMSYLRKSAFREACWRRLGLRLP